MPGGRQVSNNQSQLQGRMGASQPTPPERIHGPAMGPAPTHMFANTAPPYNAHLQQHQQQQQQQHRPASGLLPSPQASAPCYPSMPYQPQHGQFYASIPPGEVFHGQQHGAYPAVAAGGQFGQHQSSSGSYAYQTVRVANGFNAQAVPSMHPPQQQQHHHQLQLQRTSPLSTAVPLVHSRTPSTGSSSSSNTSSPGPAADSSALKQVYICCYCAQSASPYRYEDSEHGGPPTLTECRSEHLMDAEKCKQTFLQVFAADYKKATGDECLEKEIIEEAHLCTLCQVVVLNKEFKRQLHLSSSEHKARKAAASAPAMVHHHQANEQVPLPAQQQQQQHNRAMQQQRMVYQQPMPQDVYQYQGSPQPASNMAYHTLPPYYPAGTGQAAQQQGGQQMGRNRRATIPPSQGPASASAATNEARKHNIRMVLQQQQQQDRLQEPAQAQALTVQGGVAGDMSPEGRPSTASSISLDSVGDSLAYDDISPQGWPMAAPPSMALPLAPSPDKPMVYQSPMEMAEEVMKDGAGFPPDLDLAPLPAPVSLAQALAQAQAPPVTVSQTVDVPASPAPIPAHVPALPGRPRVAEVSAEIVAAVNTSPATPPEVEAEPAKPIMAPPAVKEDSDKSGGSQSILDLGGSDGDGEGKGAADAVPIKTEPKDELVDLRHAAANDIDADFFKHCKRPLSPTNHLPPTPPTKKTKVIMTLKKEGTVACDPGIHKKKKVRPQSVAVGEREPHKLYICQCGELCQRKRDYFNHWERHTFPFAGLSLAQRQLYCVRALCGYLATNDLDYTRHAARHVMLQVAYRKHHH